MLKQLLNKENRKRRKPYGHHATDVVLDFQDSMSPIIKEWKDFQNVTNVGAIQIDELSEEQIHLNEDKKWKALFLFVYGEPNPTILAQFPEISKLIRRWKDEITLVFFSIMEPGKHIPPHEGNNHGVLRMQFGIDIPEPEKTGLKVSDKVINLRNQEVFIFDDTFTHEAWNNSSFSRTVLIIDIRKKYSYFYNILNKIDQNRIRNSDYVQTLLKNLKTI
jgi:predicted metal-binding protein